MRQRRTGRAFCLSALTMALLAIGPKAQGGNFTFTDGNFDPSDWSSSIQLSQGTLSAVADQFNQGNPPNSRRHVFQSPAWSGSGSLYVAHFNDDFLYNPAVSGAIESLDFSYEIKHLGAVNFAVSLGVRYRPALLQGGTIYTLVGVNHADTTGNWAPFSVDSTISAEWSDINGLLQPDFSASGLPILFGYRTMLPAGCSPATATCASFSVTSALDNYRLDLRSTDPIDDDGPTEVPEPASMALAAAGLAAMRKLRSRRRDTARRHP